MAKPPANAVSSENEPVKVYEGIVKQVNSANFIIIREEVFNSYPKEKQIILNNINPPIFGRKLANNDKKSKGTNDKPFSWEAREFLRKKLVGKKVFFKIVGPVSSEGKTNRYYGDIFYPTLENNIIEELIENGLVTIKTSKSNKRNPDIQALFVLQNKAKAAMAGRWDPNAKNIPKKNISIDDVESFLKKNSKRRIKAVVECVIDGSTIKLLLLPKRNMINLYLSGIRCPKVGERFGDEAKFFVEVRLLQKDVEVTLEGVLPNNITPSFYGTIHHLKGEIAIELVKQGLAIFQKRSMKYSQESFDKLRAAEREAQENKLRHWEYYRHEGPVIAEKEIVGTVINIIREEGLLVKTFHSKNLQRIFFSNIRPARLGVEVSRGEPFGDSEPSATRTPQTLGKNVYEIPWAYEAREFLRIRCIGKKVNASVDYIQPKCNKFEEKIYATVRVDGINIVEELVKEGLATVINSLRDDQMSQCLSLLKKAEENAKQSHKGLYSKSSPLNNGKQYQDQEIN